MTRGFLHEFIVSGNKPMEVLGSDSENLNRTLCFCRSSSQTNLNRENLPLLHIRRKTLNLIQVIKAKPFIQHMIWHRITSAGKFTIKLETYRIEFLVQEKTSKCIQNRSWFGRTLTSLSSRSNNILSTNTHKLMLRQLKRKKSIASDSSQHLTKSMSRQLSHKQ
jgi:hypothetical protein